MSDDQQAPVYSAQDDARDAANWRALCAATKACFESENGYGSFAGGQDNLFAQVDWQRKGESGMSLMLRWVADNEVREDLNAAMQPGAAPTY